MTNIARCGRCLAKTILDLKTSILVGISAYIGFWLVIGLIVGLFVGGGGDGEIGIYNIVALLTCNAMAAGIFGDMKTKEGRINVLMQPASAAEKFWARILLGFIGPVIIVIIGFFILESARIIGTAIATKEWVEMIYPNHMSFCNSAYDILIFISGFLALQSYYFFGGILWPKVSFLKSLAVLTLIQIVLISVLIFILKHCTHLCYVDLSNAAIFWCMISFNILVLLLFGYLSYRRLKRATVVYGLRQ